MLTVVAGAAFGDEGAGVGAGAAGRAPGVAEEDDEFDDLFVDAFALDALVEPFFAGEVRELDETATAYAVEDEPATDVEAGAVGEGVFGDAAIVLLAGAKVVTAAVLALLGCADGGLLGAGAVAGATATVETTLTFETATGLETAAEATELGREGTGVTTATAGAGLSTGFTARRAASCGRVACCLSLSSTKGGRSVKEASVTNPSVPFCVRTFT